MKKIFLTLFLLTNTLVVFPQRIHNTYDEVLQKYVKDGLVNYAGLKKDARLQKYLDILSATDPDTLSSKSKKEAFWINAYNAFTLQVITANYPIQSINDLNKGGMIIAQLFGTTVWDKKFITINNKKYCLNDIEHEILRKKFKDPRIHFALVCGALSCPNLRSEAYTADNLDSLLTEQGKLFLNDPNKNRYNLKNKVAHLSRYFDWYKDDFGDSDEKILLFISGYLADSAVVKSIKSNPSAWNIKFIPYDWCLNVKGAKMTDKRCVFDLDSF